MSTPNQSRASTGELFPLGLLLGWAHGGVMPELRWVFLATGKEGQAAKVTHCFC